MFGSRGRRHEQNDPAEALVREVGAQLREARLARGEQIENVAENLRIRAAYLRGLEEGDLSAMPGRTYALGFLRSYARYLGFDGDDLIAQIRSSVAGLTRRAHLHGRTPLSASGLPKLPILVVSLAALAGAYAGWAYVDGRSQTGVELVDEVPDALRQQTAPADITPAIAPAQEPAIPPSGASTIELREDDDPPAQDALHSASADAPPSHAPEAMSPPPAEHIDLPEAVQGSEVLGLAAPESEPSAQGERAADIATLAAADALAALEPLAAGATPTIYRTDDAASRVILRARTRAWVHVSSTSNDYLWVRTLQPGEAFAVPDRQGLVLWTGNAGGIEVIVDGEPLPPLGPEARVVRDVSLQPDDLLRRLMPTPAAGE